MKKNTITPTKRSGLASQRVKVAGKMEKPHAAGEVIARETVESGNDKKGEEMLGQHEFGAEEWCGGEDECGGSNECGDAADRGQGAVEQQRREYAHEGMGGHGGDKGTQQ
jgi:hypothetical protein